VPKAESRVLNRDAGGVVGVCIGDVEPELIETTMRGMADQQQEIIADSCMLEIHPRGHFVTYSVGVPLMDMRDPEKARGRAPIG
jgi:hypothetical protein